VAGAGRSDARRLRARCLGHRLRTGPPVRRHQPGAAARRRTGRLRLREDRVRSEHLQLADPRPRPRLRGGRAHRGPQLVPRRPGHCTGPIGHPRRALRRRR
jgi:hypothetical protein